NLLENIKKRGRSYEQNINADYLKKIEESYFKFFNQEPDLNFLIIETDHIDFVNNEDDYKKIVDCIFNCESFSGIKRVFF
ncbi:MAG: deoxynucleoside kinase, partial [Bacteroidales bacterium]